MGTHRSYLLGATATVFCLTALGASGQIAEENGGAQVAADLRFRLESEDGEASLRTGLDLNLLTATRTQSLRFSTDFGVVVPFDGDDDVTMADPRYTVSYLRDNGRSRINVNLSYRETDVDGQIIDPDPEQEPEPGEDFDETDLIADDGTRQQTSARVGLTWGLIDPWGGSISYGLSSRRYVGTSDPDLIDRDTQSLGIDLRFDLDPTVQLTTGVSARLSEDDNATMREVEAISSYIGLSWQIAPDLRFSGQAGYSENTVTQMVMGSPVSSRTEGATLGLNLTLDLPNGSLSWDADRRLTTLGLITETGLSRTLSLPRGRSVEARIGVAGMPSGEAYWIGSLGYSQDTRLGQFSLAASRSVAVNSEDDEVLRSALRASYGQDLANGASWSVSGSYNLSEFTDPTEADRESTRLSLNYNTPLTQDWDLATGVRWQETRTDGAASSDRNTIFVSVERRFSWRP